MSSYWVQGPDGPIILCQGPNGSFWPVMPVTHGMHVVPVTRGMPVMPVTVPETIFLKRHGELPKEAIKNWEQYQKDNEIRKLQQRANQDAHWQNLEEKLGVK